MKTILTSVIICSVIFFATNCMAQNAHFIKNGFVEFEKRSNMYALVKKKMIAYNDRYVQEAFERYKKENPQFKIAKSTLSFSTDKSLYRFTEAPVSGLNSWIAENPMADLKNIIATDFKNGTSITQKKVFEETYLVQDSVRKINWKITDETREIAGFECRRANAVIMDSVYVVAYYTNEISVSGGPESFTGLPGMILGLAMPHENITWFATKVTEITVTEKDLAPPVKGDPIDNKKLSAILGTTMKNWGANGKSILKAYSL